VPTRALCASPEPPPLGQAPRPDQRLGLKQAVMLLWLVTAVALNTIALASNHGGSQGTCPRSWAMSCIGATSAPNSVLGIP
jgi:hypothetical protein